MKDRYMTKYQFGTTVHGQTSPATKESHQIKSLATVVEWTPTVLARGAVEFGLCS
jgi:hypothetical protein